MLSADIRKRLGHFQLDVRFKAENETLALLGASGSGKSITLRCIAGIMTPDEGQIILDGRTLFDSEKQINLPPSNRKIGYLFQQYALFPHMTVRENVGVSIADKRKRTQTTDELLHRFQLSDVSEQRPFQLSGGQQQRTALARILATEPQAMLLDEPFAALDSYLKAQLEQDLRDTLDGFGGSVIWVTHDRDEVFRNCSKICVVDNGKSQKVVTPRTLFANPGSVSAAKLSGCKNIIPVEPDGSRVRVPNWNVSLNCGRETAGTTAIGLRAHHIYFCQEDEPYALKSEVIRTMDNVFSTIVILRPVGSVPGAPTLRLELSQLPPDLGKTVCVAIAPEDILLLKS